MELKLYQLDTGADSGSIEVSDAVVGQDFNETLVHQVVTTYLAGSRQGTRAQKNRAAVRGGGAKPWRQKGTGRARSGTIRSPIWVGGGRTFANSNQDFSKKLNKKAYKSGLRSIFSELVRQERLVIVEDFELEAPKTKMLVSKLKGMSINDALVVISEANENIFLASRNLVDVEVNVAGRLSPVSLVKHEKVVATRSAIEKIQEALA